MAHDFVVQPVRKERVSRQVALEICRMVRNGRLASGDSLPPERELAVQLGVSRASLREALRGLEVAGIVETRHGGGTVVRNFSAFGTESPLAMIFEASHNSVSDLWEVRRIVEPALAERAAVRASDSDIAWLEEMLERHRKPYLNPDEGEVTRALDREFHSGVARLTGNEAAEQVILMINTLVHTGYRSDRVFVIKRRQQAYRRHLAIFESIKSGDPVEARAQMVGHLEEIEEHILEEVIDNQNEDDQPELDVDCSE